MEGGEVNEVKTVSNESLEIWRSFINLLALLGELCHTSKVCLGFEEVFFFGERNTLPAT